MKDLFDKRTIDMFDDIDVWNQQVEFTDFTPFISQSVSASAEEVQEYIRKNPIERH